MPDRVGYVRQARRGEHIVREGDAGSEMFVIQRGEVEIRKRAPGRDVVLATLGRGEFFGEMSLLESLPRDADAIVVSDEASLLVIGQGALLIRLRRDPTFSLELLHALSRRVRGLTAEVIAAMSEPSESSSERTTRLGEQPP